MSTGINHKIKTGHIYRWGYPKVRAVVTNGERNVLVVLGWLAKSYLPVYDFISWLKFVVTSSSMLIFNCPQEKAIAFPDFHHINTTTVDNFELSLWYAWMCGWEEIAHVTLQSLFEPYNIALEGCISANTSLRYTYFYSLYNYKDKITK